MSLLIFDHFSSKDALKKKKLSIVDLQLCIKYMASLVAQSIKNLPAMKETACNAGDLSSTPGFGRLLEKEMTIHSSILVWEIPWTEEPSRLQSIGSQDMT